MDFAGAVQSSDASFQALRLSDAVHPNEMFPNRGCLSPKQVEGFFKLNCKGLFGFIAGSSYLGGSLGAEGKRGKMDCFSVESLPASPSALMCTLPTSSSLG